MSDYISLLSFGPNGWGDELASGLLITVTLALATLPFGLLAGFLLALGKNSEEATLKAAANIYTTIFRGLPELLTLFIVYYGAQIALQSVIKLFSDSASIEINGFIAGMVALGCVFAAYASEVFLSAFKGIKAGQYEAGHALGLSRFHTLRLVILPQLIKLALPGLSNLWLILVKETSLVSVIALSDFMRQTRIAVGVTKEAFFFYLLACLVYVALAILSSIGIRGLERWSSRGDAEARS